MANLKDELDAGHPITGPYDADAVIATEQLHTKNIVRDRVSIAPGEMQAQVVGTDFAALSAVQQRAWLAILADSVDPANTNIVEQITAIWSGTTTLTNLAGIRTETVSRVVELGLGIVKVGHVERARAA